MPELDFKGKEFVRNHHLTVPFRPVVPDASKSVGEPDLDGNLIIHGDNLEALKSLLPRYAGKVDCIFIDPPYNTGNERWCYNDNVDSPILRAWFSENPVTIEDGLRHDKWCCMMWPRLKLLHELLAESGSLWITLDDNEAHRAKHLLDEMFGSDGFVANIVWQHSVQGKGYTNTFSVHHNHLLVYGKPDFAFDGLDRTDEDNVNYANPDDDPKGPWRPGDVKNSLFRPNLRYEVVSPSGKVIQPPPNGWRWSRETLNKKIASKEVIFIEEGTKILRKIYLCDQEKRAPETLWFANQVGSSRDATGVLKDMFGGDSPFPTPKPVELLARILELASTKHAVVLDSFAGSGTTAHAVLAANSKDRGNRKFILVECEDYADTLTAERVRRVIHGYPFEGTQRETLYEKKLTWTELKKGDALKQEAENTKAMYADNYDAVRITVDDGVLKVIGERNVQETAPGLGGTFTYCTLGEPLGLERLLEGAGLPSREALGDWLLYVAGAPSAPDPEPTMSDELRPHFLAKRGGVCYWFLYRPDADYLRHAALTLDLARAIAASDPAADHRVFGPQKFVSNKLLRTERLRVEFAQIPFALFRSGAE